MISITTKRSDSLYFPTGDIVLLSLPKDGIVTAFKVDRVFLIRSSPVFEGMFALPPSSDVESYDNVPLVKLQDDSDHLTMFLKVLYDSRCIPWQKHNSSTVRMIEGILLLATKYQIDHLRERMISLLEQDWPSKLSDWDANEAEMKVKRESVESDWDVSFPDPCEAIRLARRCEVPSILPAAFYSLSRLRGVSDTRMSDSLQQIIFDLDTDPIVPTTNFSLLSAQDFYSLVVGRDVILLIFDNYLDDAFREMATREHATTNSDREKCRKVVAECRIRLGEEVFQDFKDPLSVMKGGDNHHPHDCQRCWYEFIGLLKSKREVIWANLPSIFMLDQRQ